MVPSPICGKCKGQTEPKAPGSAMQSYIRAEVH